MSGVEITGLIKPLNSGAFPVWEDINGFGGYRSVADITARDAIPTNFRKHGMEVYVKSLQVVYELAADLTTWVFSNASPTLSLQTTWTVDPSGNDNNDGSVGSPLLTLTELSNRLNPRGTTLYL